MRSGAWRGHLTLRREVADGDVHVRRLWQLDFGKALTFTSTWYYEDHLLPIQIAVVKAEIARWPRVQWEQWPLAQAPSWEQTDRPIGSFREEWPSGSVDTGVCLRYGTLIVLFAALPAFLFLRGIGRAIAQIRSQRGPLGPARPAGRKISVGAAVSFLLLLVISAVWLESEVSGIAAKRVWIIARDDGGTYCGSVRLVSLGGTLHVAYLKGGPELHYPTPSTDDPLPAPWQEATQFHWHAAEDDPVLEESQPVNMFGSFAPATPEQWHGWPGLRIGSVIDADRHWFEVIGCYWLPWALSLPLPLFWLARRRGWIGRRAAGLCPACGYDLRASSTRCPECGVEVRAGSAAAATSAPDTWRLSRNPV